MLLAKSLTQRDGVHAGDVTLVTRTPKDKFNDGELPFTVVRRPRLGHLLRIIRHSDIIHLAGPVIAPLVLSNLLRKRAVIEHHGYQACCPNGLLLYQPTKTVCPGHFMQHEYMKCLQCNASESGWFASTGMLLRMWPRRWLCRRAGGNLCITQHVARRLQLPRSTVVYYGVPGAREDTLVPDIDTGSTPEKSTRQLVLSVAYLGRLVHEKGVPTLIEAMRLLQAGGKLGTLMIIGDGPERAHLEAMANGTPGLRKWISFAGSLEGEALRDALKSADVLVMPSVNEEPAGLVIMEQMAQGKPVIVSDHGGGPELAGDAGLKFPPGDAVALAKCLERLADEPGLLKELGMRARKRAAALFTLERMVNEHQQIFEELVRGPVQ